MSAGADRLLADARYLVELVTEAPSPSLEQLSRALDRVAWSFDGVPDQVRPGFEPPSLPAPDRNLVAARFPELGLYSAGDPRKFHAAPEIADAIDDIMDIVGDLSVAIAIASDAGSDEAARHLQIMADHWLTHLRRLGLLLHVLKYDRW